MRCCQCLNAIPRDYPGVLAQSFSHRIKQQISLIGDIMPFFSSCYDSCATVWKKANQFLLKVDKYLIKTASLSIAAMLVIHHFSDPNSEKLSVTDIVSGITLGMLCKLCDHIIHTKEQQAHSAESASVTNHSHHHGKLKYLAHFFHVTEHMLESAHLAALAFTALAMMHEGLDEGPAINTGLALGAVVGMAEFTHCPHTHNSYQPLL